MPTSDLFIKFHVKITYSSNRIIHAPVLNGIGLLVESIETALKKNVVTSITLTIPRFGKTVFPIVYVGTHGALHG